VKTSEKIRDLKEDVRLPGKSHPLALCPVRLVFDSELDALADEVAELEKQRVPDGWMPYRLVHEVTEDEVIVMPEGWFLERDGDPEKSTRLGDFRLPWQEAIALAEAAEEASK